MDLVEHKVDLYVFAARLVRAVLKSIRLPIASNTPAETTASRPSSTTATVAPRMIENLQDRDIRRSVSRLMLPGNVLGAFRETYR